MAEPVNMQYISDISNALSSLATTLFVRGKLNLTDTHVMSEGFYEGLLNLMYDLNLHNTNSDQQNAEGIDLVDMDAKIIMQVTATCNKSKIDHALSELKPEYAGFHFIFVPVTIKDTKSQRAHQYNAPHNIVFDPKKDIYDIPFLVRELAYGKCADKAGSVADYIKKNLRFLMLDERRLSSGLEYMIRELSKDGSEEPSFDAKDFEIDAKISFNGLSYGEGIIRDYADLYPRVKRIYDEYAKQAQYKSMAVLQKFHSIYLTWKQTLRGDELFKKIESEVVSLVNVANLPKDFTQEELEMCADILIVHAFMECKIFEKPI